MKIEPSPSTDPYEVLAKIQNAYDFCYLFFPDIQPYRWQIEALMQLSGYTNPYDEKSRVTYTKEDPLLYTLCAANGSGKDQIVLAIWALYCVCCIKDFHWIATSSSYTQLNEQTWHHIKVRAQQINAQLHPKFLRINKHKVQCDITKAQITLFRTDEGGKTEGWHPLVKNGPMAIALNEMKSIDQELIMSFKRCHGYTHWVNISSPGKPTGYFYEKCTSPNQVWPQNIVPGQNYFRRIDWTECPHLASEYKRDAEEFGVESPYVQSSYWAQFTTSNLFYIVAPDKIKYEYPARSTYGLPKRAGLDLALGGDVVVLSIWEGNYFVKEREFFERHEPTLTRMLCAAIEEEQLAPAQVYADAGGTGTPIIQRMHEAGCNVNGVLNQSSPRNKKVFYNRGAELALNFQRLVYDKILNLENISSKLKRQMGMRYYDFKEAKIILESKVDFRARAGFSPDHFDAAILAHAGVNCAILREAANMTASEEEKRKVPDSVWADWNNIYGDLDNTTARAGAYRTGGFFGQRTIGTAIQGITERLGQTRNKLARQSRRL